MELLGWGIAFLLLLACIRLASVMREMQRERDRQWHAGYQARRVRCGRR